MRFIIIILIFSFLACNFQCRSIPEKENYLFSECYVAMDCMYRNKGNHDKSICMNLIQSCSDALKEQRQIKRLSFCKEFKPADMTERECRMWLNQK